MAILEYRTGSLLFTNADLVVIPVNCVGVMGAGLAKQAAELEPRLVASLRMARMRPGDFRLLPSIRKLVTTARHQTYNLGFAFAATKDDWRNPSQLIWIEKILQQMRNSAHLAEKTVGLPYLGCGLGGLSVVDVRRLFDEHLPHVNCGSVIVVDQGVKHGKG